MTADDEIILFVSHHSSKVELAGHVEHALAKRGIRCWIAPRDVPPGEPFDRAVRSAIEKSTALLLLFCSQSDQSRHVKREVILADSSHLPIIPIRLEAIDPGELSYFLADSQWIDWIERRDAVFDTVAEQARQFAGKSSADTPPLPRPPETPSESAKAGNALKWGIGGAAVAAAAIAGFFWLNPSRETGEPENFRTSFDCGAVDSASAVMICRSEDLAARDLEMASLYYEWRTIVHSRTGDTESVRQDQLAWLERVASCTNEACIRDLQIERIDYLEDQLATLRQTPAGQDTIAAPAEDVSLSPTAAPAPQTTPTTTPSQTQEAPTEQAGIERTVGACRGAGSDAEYLICADSGLQTRAREIMSLTQQIRQRYQASGGSARAFNVEQRNWFNTVRTSCRTAACITAAQTARIQQLRAILAAAG